MPANTHRKRHSMIARLGLFAVLPLLLFAAVACDEIGSDDPVETRDDTFQVSGEVVVDVDSFNGSITLNSSAVSTVRVQATLKRADKVEYKAEQFGSDIKVTARKIGSTNGRSPSAEIEITAPANSQLVLRTSNGSVEVRDFEAGATIRTSNGRITVNGLSGDLEADTSNGNIEVSNFTGSTELETSNGSVRFAGVLVAGSDNNMTSSNGSVTVDLDDNPSVVFDGATSNGSVSSEFPILATSTGRNHLEGKIGDGEAELTARTSNGSITVK